MTIPKIIHYVWVGNNKKPRIVQKCIKSWKKYCPDYEIMEWGNEILDEIDVDYVKEAMEAKKYAFVSDYIRLYVLNKYGGIYLDTDTELTASIDQFLNLDFFIGLENWNEIINFNAGLIGVTKNNEKIIKILKEYENIHFLQSDGSFDMTPNPQRFCAFFKKEYKFNSMLDIKIPVSFEENCMIYPWWYFCKAAKNKPNYAIHHYYASWAPELRQLKFRDYLFSIIDTEKHRIIRFLGFKFAIKRGIKNEK